MSLMPEAFISSIQTASFQDWTVYFYSEFKPNLTEENGQLNSEVVELLTSFTNKNFASFRREFVIGSTPFLVAFYFDKKEIRFYSPKLSQELFILQQSDILDLDIKAVKELRKHVELAAGLKAKDFPSVIETLIQTKGLPDLLNDSKYAPIEQRTNEIIKDLLGNLNAYRPSLFEKVSDFALSLTAQFALLRIHLLKFLAILPSLDHDKSGKEVKRILLEALKRFLKDNKKAKIAKKKGQERALPNQYVILIKVGYNLAKLLPAYPLATLVRSAVKIMAKRFIAGETIEKADHSLKGLFSTHRDVTLDQLGELVVSEVEADHYKNEVLKLIRGFNLHVKRGEVNKAGIKKAHVSIKVSALCSDFKPHAFDYTYNLVAPRLIEILTVAKYEDVFINVDAEHYHYRDLVFKIFKKVLLETPELHDYADTGIVIQAYLRDGYDHLKDVIALAKERGIMMPVRLVKGAYWDAETVEGDAHSFNAPQFLNKEETDIHYRQLVIKILESYPHLKLAVASHNFSDHAFTEATKELFFPHVGEVEHQCLHMTYEALSTALAKMGWATRNYVPVGSLLVGMAYLVRRIMENSSQVGVLTIMRSHKKGVNLHSPYEIHKEKKRQGTLVRDVSEAKLDDSFFNVSPLKLYLDHEKDTFAKELEKFQGTQLNQFYPNHSVTKGTRKTVVSSSDTDITVGSIDFASVEDAKAALNTIDEAYRNGRWANASWSYRTASLVKAANILLARRNELSSLICYEAGKSIAEALGDVDEAIDFLNFYSRTEAFLQKNHEGLTSRGPSVVIAPWNFPLAIPCGMVVSALVAGNTVILKSAEQTSLIAQKLIDILHESGIPKDVLVHLPGEGEVVGDYLVKDARVSTIIFTGSMAVGTYIHGIVKKRLYKNPLTSKIYPAKAITEMGGKNAIVVTQNAELDETVSGILQSAFGHAGQKCSACSRVIVHNSLKEKLKERLKAAASDLNVGKAYNFNTTINPIITKEDQLRLQKQVVEAAKEAISFGGEVVIDRSCESLPGYAIGPVIVELPYERAFDKSSYAQRELFGPVIHLIGFDDLDDAIKLFNSSIYALTGGIFSQSQDDIDYLVSKLEAGNLYINRTITGARVAIEPFGGFKLSGTGPKAGGRQYLLSLHQTMENVKFEDVPHKAIQEGHDSPIELKKHSKLNWHSRLERMEKFLDVFTGEFETHFSSIQKDYKDNLRDYRKWMSKNYENFVTKEHKNRVIPGQLSFNDFSLSAHHALFVAVNAYPTQKSLIQALSAILSGTGLTIVTRNSQSFQWWMRVRDMLFKAGFSKENIEVYFATTTEFKKILNNKQIAVVIYDGPMNDFDSDLSHFFDTSLEKDELFLKNILTIHDYVNSYDYYNQLLHFVCVRSLAINTMRHGAPLDLDL